MQKQISHRAMLRRLKENLGAGVVACVGASGRVYCEASRSVTQIAGDPIVYYADEARLWSDFNFGTVSKRCYRERLRDAADEALEKIQSYWENRLLVTTSF